MMHEGLGTKMTRMRVGTLTLKRWLAVDIDRDDFPLSLILPVGNSGRSGRFGDGNRLWS